MFYFGDQKNGGEESGEQAGSNPAAGSQHTNQHSKKDCTEADRCSSAGMAGARQRGDSLRLALQHKSENEKG